MATWGWIVVVLAVLIISGGVAYLIALKRRTAALRERFGPEYDRTLQGAGSRREAETELRQREETHSQLQIRPLPAAARSRYAEAWQGIQARFIDEPSSAVGSADRLVTAVMEARGYPVEDFESQADLVSVDHPEVADNYRVAHGIHNRNLSNQATTEQLRDSLLRYRRLFDELLRDEPEEMPESREDRVTRETRQDRTDRSARNVPAQGAPRQDRGV